MEKDIAHGTVLGWFDDDPNLVDFHRIKYVAR